MELPNGKVVDILSSVFQEIGKWLQIQPSLPESGGYIVGYKHKKTGNISLEAVSHPYPCDRHGREYIKVIIWVYGIPILKEYQNHQR